MHSCRAYTNGILESTDFRRARPVFYCFETTNHCSRYIDHVRVITVRDLATVPTWPNQVPRTSVEHTPSPNNDRHNGHAGIRCDHERAHLKRMQPGHPAKRPLGIDKQRPILAGVPRNSPGILNALLLVETLDERRPQPPQKELRENIASQLHLGNEAHRPRQHGGERKAVHVTLVITDHHARPFPGNVLQPAGRHRHAGCPCEKPRRAARGIRRAESDDVALANAVDVGKVARVQPAASLEEVTIGL